MPGDLFAEHSLLFIELFDGAFYLLHRRPSQFRHRTTTTACGSQGVSQLQAFQLQHRSALLDDHKVGPTTVTATATSARPLQRKILLHPPNALVPVCNALRESFWRWRFSLRSNANPTTLVAIFVAAAAAAPAAATHSLCQRKQQ